MKKILLFVFVLISFVSHAQDSTKNTLITSVSLSSKNLWRGNVYGNNTPSISGTLGLHFKNGFEVGATGTSPVNGNRDGYGIWMETYISQSVGRFTLTIDDYYFFNAQDSLNDYFNWGRDNTQHLVEGRVKYDGGRFNTTASYVLYAASGVVNNLYLEGEYFILPKMLSVSIGGVFGASSLNFYDAGGITHFGFSGYRDIKVSNEFYIPLKVSLMTSPNYKNASKYPAFTQNPINFVIGITL